MSDPSSLRLLLFLALRGRCCLVFLPPPSNRPPLGGIAQRSCATRYHLLSRYVCLLIPANHLLIVQYSFHVQVCVKCHLDKIVPYIPNIDAEGVLRSGPSPSIKALAPAIAQDIPPLQLYLSTLNQLSKEISDMCNWVRHLVLSTFVQNFVMITLCPPPPALLMLPFLLIHRHLSRGFPLLSCTISYPFKWT